MTPEPKIDASDPLEALSADRIEAHFERVRAQLDAILDVLTPLAAAVLQQPPGALGSDAQGSPPNGQHQDEAGSPPDMDARPGTGGA